MTYPIGTPVRILDHDGRWTIEQVFADAYLISAPGRTARLIGLDGVEPLGVIRVGDVVTFHSNCHECTVLHLRRDGVAELGYGESWRTSWPVNDLVFVRRAG